MILLQRDESLKIDFVSESEKEKTTDESHRLLGGGGSESKEDDEEAYESPIDKEYFRRQEGWMFDYCMVAHIVCFLLIILFLYLKKS
jgi:hypothetical protein